MHIVLVHGWSVFDISTYGKLPDRLIAESTAGRLPGTPGNVTVDSVWLGRYISFKDEVRLEDLAAAFHAAFEREVKPKLNEGERFVCITHSTGGPVLRHWWWQFYQRQGTSCPMSHLVMLAPANFGSALAQLGKGRLSRLRSWWNGVEPGQGVLDWLEHGSDDSWELNRRWITDSTSTNPAMHGTLPPVFQFVLIGQTIDRAFYDQLNNYTGEAGSDGTVRVAAANLNATYLRLEQHVTPEDLVACDAILRQLKRGGRRPDLDKGRFRSTLHLRQSVKAAPTAFRLIKGASHVGASNGILFSIKNDGQPNEVVSAILRCLHVQNSEDYDRLCREFEAETNAAYQAERIESPDRRLRLRQKRFIRDAHSLILVRIRDHEGHVLTDFDLKITGPNGTANDLPEDFLTDRQKNLVNKSTLTFYINSERLYGYPPVEEAAPRLGGVDMLGFRLYAYPVDGFVRFHPAIATADESLLKEIVRPHQPTLVDIQLQRIVCEGTFALQSLQQRNQPFDFRKQDPGNPIP